MDDIYSRLNLPENSSKEELKAAFMAWKKPRQEILKTGTHEEQAQATKEISEMTILYKEACGISDLATPPRKIKSSGVKIEKNSSRSRNTASRGEETASSVSSSSNYETDSGRKLNIALCLVIIILGGVIFYLYNKNSSAPATPFVTQNISQRKEKSDTSINNFSVKKDSESKLPEIKPIVEDKNIGKTPEQRAAVQTLLDFHENITQKSLRKAYDCMSHNLQYEISYDGWTPGFQNTISSTPSNIKIISESPDRIVLTYELTAIDNPGGTQTFAGTVVIIKTSEGWKIDDVNNKLK